MINYLEKNENNGILEKVFFNDLVKTANLQLSSTCPLIEDEATVWAGAIINDYNRMKAELEEFKKAKNWTRSYDYKGDLIDQHALYRPKLAL